MTVFGRIVTDDQVEDAALATLSKWLPTYMSEVERQVGLDAGFYERPPAGSYTVRSRFDKWPEEMLPLVIVIATGVADDPAAEGRGKFRAEFEIGVACVVSSVDIPSSRRYANRMGAAVRAALVQHQSLDQAIEGSVRGVDWLGERNNELPQPEPGERTIWANRQLFNVEVGDVLTKAAGPIAPDPLPDPTTPWPDDPTVDTIDDVDITLEKIPQ